MNGIFITDASAVFADKLTLDDTIIKGGKFYFGKLEKDFEPIDDERYDLRCNRVLKYLVDKLDLSGFEKMKLELLLELQIPVFKNLKILKTNTTQNLEILLNF